MQKKIGIITFHSSRNYGAVLQAYALQKRLSEHFKKVEIIDYRNDKIEKELRLWDGPIHSIRAFFHCTAAFIFRTRKKIAFDRFLRKYITTSRKVTRDTVNRLSDAYDIYISGSDQVWNTWLTGQDRSYFLDFVRDDKIKIAYAVSFGDMQIEITKNMQEWIQRFELVTLREKKYCRELEGYIHKPVTVCCDPSILLTKDTWCHLASNRLCRKPYIFLMMIEESLEIQEYAKRIAKEKNLIIISNKNCFRFFLHPSPADFLSWIYNAEYVVTNSFHGTVFSLLFEKSFVAGRYSSQGKLKTRIAELLDRAGLKHRVTDNEVLELDEYIPWDNVNDALLQMRQESWDYLYNWISDYAGGDCGGK